MTREINTYCLIEVAGLKKAEQHLQIFLKGIFCCCYVVERKKKRLAKKYLEKLIWEHGKIRSASLNSDTEKLHKMGIHYCRCTMVIRCVGNVNYQNGKGEGELL